MELSSQNTNANSRNQEWLMLAKKADHDPSVVEKMMAMLPFVNPYENNCMLPRCCAQFGYIEGLHNLIRVAPNAEWERVMVAAVMGRQKKAVEVLLAHIDPLLSVKEGAANPVPNQALRICIESGQDDVLPLLIAVVPSAQRPMVLLWILEEYNYAFQKNKPTDMFESSIRLLCPATNAASLLKKDSGLPLNTPARDFLAEMLDENSSMISDINLNITLRKNL